MWAATIEAPRLETENSMETQPSRLFFLLKYILEGKFATNRRRGSEAVYHFQIQMSYI
jgi:hypothetical protein